MVNETEGKYFTIGMYIAMREKSDNYWRISKVTINPNNSKEMSITLVANRMYKLEAIEWMEDQTDTTEAHKTDNSGIDVEAAIQRISENPDYWTKGNEPN